MRLTNDLDLPQPLYLAILEHGYEHPGGLTVTELTAPARQMALVNRYRDEIVEDASERIFALLGSTIHDILRRAGEAYARGIVNDGGEVPLLVEERLSMPILGVEVSGKFDHYELMPSGRLDDWKLTSLWAIIDRDSRGLKVKPEWVAQLNCYAHLLRHHGYHVNALQNVFVLRDWSKRKARHERNGGNYPQRQGVKIPYPASDVWSPERTQAYLEERVRAHTAARETTLPYCTQEERWEPPTEYAVMKAGNQRATRVLKSKEDAERYILNLGGKAAGSMRVDVRLGERVRCEDYCPVREFCEAQRDGQWPDEAVA